MVSVARPVAVGTWCPQLVHIQSQLLPWSLRVWWCTRLFTGENAEAQGGDVAIPFGSTTRLLSTCYVLGTEVGAGDQKMC